MQSTTVPTPSALPERRTKRYCRSKGAHGRPWLEFRAARPTVPLQRWRRAPDVARALSSFLPSLLAWSLVRSRFRIDQAPSQPSQPPFPIVRYRAGQRLDLHAAPPSTLPTALLPKQEETSIRI